MVMYMTGQALHHLYQDILSTIAFLSIESKELVLMTWLLAFYLYLPCKHN